MLNIIINLRDANENQDETPLHTHQNDYNQEGGRRKIVSVEKNVGKLEPLHIASRNVKWCCHFEK